MRKKVLLFVSFFIATLLIMAIYSFALGSLSPISPIIIGFDRKIFDRATVYHHKDIDISKFNIIDNLIKETENFHQLKFKEKVDIIICNSDNEFARRTLGSKARLITSPLYGRIFISSKAKAEMDKAKINFLVYLKHELSHSLLFQNMSLYRSQYFPGWLLEGIAVYSANQMGVDGYYTKEETFAKIKAGYFLNPEDWSTTILKPQSSNVNKFPLSNKYYFIYSEFGCLVDDLTTRYGREKFQQFLTALLKDGDVKQIFQHIYGIKFSNYLDDFKKKSEVDMAQH